MLVMFHRSFRNQKGYSDTVCIVTAVMVEPTHLKNMRKSTWMMSQMFGVKISKIFETTTQIRHIEITSYYICNRSKLLNQPFTGTGPSSLSFRALFKWRISCSCRRHVSSNLPAASPKSRQSLTMFKLLQYGKNRSGMFWNFSTDVCSHVP